MKLKFKPNRGAPCDGNEQDILVSGSDEFISIEQWDGTGDPKHCVVISGENLSLLRYAIDQVQTFKEPAVLINTKHQFVKHEGEDE